MARGDRRRRAGHQDQTARTHQVLHIIMFAAFVYIVLEVKNWPKYDAQNARIYALRVV